MYRKVLLFALLLPVLAVTLIASIGTSAPPPGKGGGGGGGGDTSTTSYTIHKLDDDGGQFVAGYQHVVDINDVGGVVGNVEAAVDNSRHAAFWQLSGGTSELTLLDDGGFDATGAYGINDSQRDRRIRSCSR
jgi:hypothetical protein